MNKHSITITSITCHGTSESGHDEVYLICQSDAGLPIRIPASINTNHPMEKGDTWSINQTLNYDYEVLVTLWDEDLSYDPNLATYLQSIDFVAGTLGLGSGVIQLTNRNGANYSVSYNLLK